ncbi:uncharacterized protein AKAME5_002687500 [Lates japonicus]|uniref:Uncharacterized protein n=1 Tax=Lates japonicus TaxID=270547 RepID=A0AAD3RP39_LATJO|nr:uncharacterized protein AKAME5_002687500 [Lates japonicus]
MIDGMSMKPKPFSFLSQCSLRNSSWKEVRAKAESPGQGRRPPSPSDPEHGMFASAALVATCWTGCLPQPRHPWTPDKFPSVHPEQIHCLQQLFFLYPESEVLTQYQGLKPICAGYYFRPELQQAVRLALTDWLWVFCSVIPALTQPSQRLQVICSYGERDVNSRPAERAPRFAVHCQPCNGPWSQQRAPQHAHTAVTWPTVTPASSLPIAHHQPCSFHHCLPAATGPPQSNSPTVISSSSKPYLEHSEVTEVRVDGGASTRQHIHITSMFTAAVSPTRKQHRESRGLLGKMINDMRTP